MNSDFSENLGTLIIDWIRKSSTFFCILPQEFSRLSPVIKANSTICENIGQI